jgi:FtsH-binding integral membrane protein
LSNLNDNKYRSYENVQVQGNRIMQGVYLWMAVGLGITTLVSYVVAVEAPQIMLMVNGNMFGIFGMLIIQMGLVIVLGSRIQKLATGTAIALFMLYSALTGVSLSVIFWAYTSESLVRVFGITAVTFLGLSIYGITTKRDLTGLGQMAMMLFWGLFVATLVNMFLRSDTFQYVLSFFGVGIFTAMTAYKTQEILKMSKQHENSDQRIQSNIAILGALVLYITFINLFLSLLRIFGDRR